MGSFISNKLIATIIIGAVSLGLLKLLIVTNRRHWQKVEQEKMRMAMELFEGDEAAARTWLSTPSKSLGGFSPLHAKLEDVSDLIGRIQHGVIS